MDVDFNRVGYLNGDPRLGLILRRFSAPKKYAVCAHANLHDFLFDGGMLDLFKDIANRYELGELNKL